MITCSCDRMLIYLWLNIYVYKKQILNFNDFIIKKKKGYLESLKIITKLIKTMECSGKQLFLTSEASEIVSSC